MPGFSVGSATVDIVPDARGFQQKLDAQIRNVQVQVQAVLDENGVQQKLDAVTRDATVKVKIKTDDAAFLRELKQTISGREVKIKVTTEGLEKARALLDDIAQGRRSDINVSTDGVAKAEALLDAAARDRTSNIDVDTGGATRKLGDVKQSAGFASGAMAGMVAIGATIGPAIVPAAGAAAAAVLAIGPAAISSAAGIGVLVFGLKGVIGAISDRVKADQAASVATVKAARTQAQSANQMIGAQATLANAEASLANTRATAAAAAKKAAQTVIDAQRGVKDAVRDASRSVADAQERAAEQVQSAVARQVAAERTLEGALLGEEQAQRSLSQARQQAKRDIEDLTNAVADGQLSQRQAALDVQTTYDALVAAQDSGSRIEREQAQLAYDRATQRQKELAQDQARLGDEKKTSDKQGVEGSPQVEQAKRDLEAAKQAVKDAQSTFTAAQKAVAKAQVDGQEAVAEAQRDAARSIEAAERRLSDARQARTEQARQSAFSIAQAESGVESAQRGVADASAAAAAGLAANSAAADKAADSYANLTPEGKALSDFFTDVFLPGFEKVRKRMEAPLALGILKGLKGAEPLAKPLTDLAENLATAFGHIAENVGKALGSPFWVDFFDMIAKQSGPATEGIGKFIGDILTGIAGLMTAFQPFAKDIGRFFLDMGENFKDFGTGKSGGLQKFLDFIKENGHNIASDVGAIALAIADIAIASAPIGIDVLNVLGNFARSITEMDSDTLSRNVRWILGFVAGVTALIAVVSGITAVGTAIRFLAGAFGLLLSANPVGLIIAGIALLVIGLVALYKRGGAFTDFIDKRLIPGLKQMGEDFMWMWENQIKPAARAIQQNWRDMVSDFKDMVQDFKDFGHRIAENWRQMGRDLKYMWTDQLRPVFQAIGHFVTDTIPGWFRSGRDWVVRVWHGMVSGIKSLWTDSLKPVFQAIGNFVTKDVPAAFDRGVAAVGRAWDGLKELAKKPIDFIVNTVINDGILRAFRAISKVVGYEDGKNLKVPWPPKGWSSGGYTGPGGKYDPRGIVHAGEVVFDQDAVSAAGGPLRLDAFRNALKSGTARLEGFAKGGIVWPTNTKRLSGNYAGHSGVDIAAGEGAPIYAATSGTIQYTGGGRGYGQAIFERAVNGLNMVYGHTSKILAKVGQMVQAGDHIGNVGHTGNATGPHLHFEIAPDGSFAKASNRAATLSWLGGANIDPSGTEPGADNGFFAPVVDYVKKLKDGLSGPLGRLKEAGDSPWAQVMAGLPKLLVDPLLAKIRGEQPAADSSGASSTYTTTGGEPLQNAAIIASVGSSMGRRAQIIGIATAIVESGLRNLSYGDRDSVGLFQQRAPWGSFAARTNPKVSAGMFFHGGRGGQRGLDDIPGWRSLPMGRAAQAVQVSAFPGRYQERIAQATGILDTLKKATRAKDVTPVRGKATPSIYDAGGWLQPGTTVVHNNTGQPEPVFNPSQWRSLERLAAGRGNGRTVNIAKVETADHRGLAKAIESEWALQDALYPSWG